MKCQLCNKQEATVQIKQVNEGVIRELYVCRDCAIEHGLDIESAVPWLSNLMMGEASAPVTKAAREDAGCPECHMRLSDFRKTQLLGCPACYEAFSRDLAPVIASMQRGADRHRGKIPRSYRTRGEIERLRADLAAAVEAQQFERAAEIRDRIRRLSETGEIEALTRRLAAEREAAREDGGAS